MSEHAVLTKEERKRLINYWVEGPSRLAFKLLVKKNIPQGKTQLDLPLKMTMQGKFRYPLRTMELGQRFFVPRGARTVVQVNDCVTSSVSHERKTTGRQFYQRRYLTGVRVWRIA